MLSANMKARSASAALGSLRAEGLRPTVKTQKLAEKYVSGKITKIELRKHVIKSTKLKNR